MRYFVSFAHGTRTGGFGFGSIEHRRSQPFSGAEDVNRLGRNLAQENDWAWVVILNFQPYPDGSNELPT